MDYTDYDLVCKKTRFDISNINMNCNSGTATLTHKCDILKMVWSITNYPTEFPIPGSKYPIIVSYTIFNNVYSGGDKALKSISGQFIYELSSGTLPNYSNMKIPFGNYESIACNNKSDYFNYVLFKITHNAITVVIS